MRKRASSQRGLTRGTANRRHLGEACRAYVRGYPRVEVHPNGGGTAEFVNNQTLIRCQERMAAVAVLRPAVICVVTVAAS
jgi:hypothetical protein